MTDRYTVTDNRRQTHDWAAKYTLPKVTEQAALEATEAPVSVFDPKPDTYTPDPVQLPVLYPLDTTLRPQWGEFLIHHGYHRQAKGFLDAFKGMLPAFTGEKTTHLALGGEIIASYRRDGALNMSKLTKEQPHVIEKYTRMVTVPQFDKEAFAAAEPALYDAYRARSLRLITPKPNLLHG